MFGKKKSEIEFKGVSVSNEKRDAIVLFIIEAVVVLIFISGVLFVLNYLNIFPLSNMNSILFGWIPLNGESSFNTEIETGLALNPNEPIQKPTISNPLIDENIKASIKVESDIPKLTPTLNNNDLFILQLRNWTVYGRSYDDTVLGSTNGKPLSNINIKLTSSEKSIYPFSDKEGKLVGSGYKFDQGKLELSIYLAQRTTDFDKNKIEVLINRQALISLLALPKKLDSANTFDQALKEVNAILAEQLKTNSFFINID